MVGGETGIGIGKSVPAVKHQQFVQQGRARPPMTNDKNGIVFQFGALDPAAENKNFNGPKKKIDYAGC